MNIIEFISQPWPWYVSGVIIALIMLVLLLFGKSFGVSSTLRSACAIAGGAKYSSFFDFDWKSQIWNLVFVLGAAIGGFIAVHYLGADHRLNISENTISDLQSIGISFDDHLVPTSLFSWDNVLTKEGFITMILGGFLVGFGARWAGGCTSGHAISGLSNLQLPSLIAVIGFFIGGLVMTHFLFPFIF